MIHSNNSRIRGIDSRDCNKASFCRIAVVFIIEDRRIELRTV